MFPNAKEDSKRSETDGDADENFTSKEEVNGEGITEEQEANVEEKHRELRDEVKATGDHRVHPRLTVPTAFNNRPMLI